LPILPGLPPRRLRPVPADADPRQQRPQRALGGLLPDRPPRPRRRALGLDRLLLGGPPEARGPGRRRPEDGGGGRRRRGAGGQPPQRLPPFRGAGLPVLVDGGERDGGPGGPVPPALRRRRPRGGACGRRGPRPSPVVLAAGVEPRGALLRRLQASPPRGA